MNNGNKKAPEFNPLTNQGLDLIIANKTYTIKELNSIFNVNNLMLVNSKSELIKYEQMAVETGVKHFKEVVDKVYRMKYAI